MTGWIIFLIILIVLILILWMPAIIAFRYEEDKADVRISYFGFPIYDHARAEKKQNEKQKSGKTKKKKSSKKRKKTAAKEKASLSDQLSTLHDFLHPVSHGLRKLCKGIRITRFYLDIRVGAFDACECALSYGKMYAAVAGGLAFFQSFFVIKPEHIQVQPCFGTDRTVYNVRFCAKISPAALIGAICSVLFSYLIQMLHHPQNQQTNSKKEAPHHAGTTAKK